MEHIAPDSNSHPTPRPEHYKKKRQLEQDGMPHRQDGTGSEVRERDDGGRWVSGVSGNPGGRPKAPSVLAEIERQLDLESDDGRPQRVRLVEKLFVMALDGDTRAMDLLLKRVAPERLALEGDKRLQTRDNGH